MHEHMSALAAALTSLALSSVTKQIGQEQCRGVHVKRPNPVSP